MLFLYKKEGGDIIEMAMKVKVRKNQTIDNLVMEEPMKRSGHEGVSAMEEKQKSAHSSCTADDSSAPSRDEAIVKVGSKRTYHETQDLSSSLSAYNQDLTKTEQIFAASDKERSTMESDSKAPSSGQKDQDNNWLESARAEMGEVREENQRLKMNLSKMMKDYEALQLQFYEFMRQEQAKNSTSTVDNHQEVEEPELVSLSLGRFSSESKKDGRGSQGKEEDEKANKKEGGLSLGLECKFEGSKSHGNEPNLQNSSPINSFEEPKEEGGETWPPKAPKPVPSGDDEVVQQNPLKKARVCVRARCDTPTMHDGCQWRKYGQKIAKGNPCPRAYYRCTVAPSCPVRKQVQRCAEDMSILITTYEGTHNHPLPLSATAMASTTSAAASMLLSGSSSSSGSRTTPITPPDLHGLNYYLSDNSNSKQFYLQNPSLSTSTTHPTITLDLTSNPSSSSHNLNRFSSSSYSQIPKFATTSLNFSSGDSNSIPWGSTGVLSYGNRSQLGALSMSRPTEINYLNSYMQKKTPNIPQQDAIAAATKAITTDPSFQSALAAALTSIIGSGGEGSGGASFGNAENLAQKLKWDEHFPVASSGYSTQTTKSNACATSYLNKTTTSIQPGSLMFLPPSLPFSSPKSSASASPGDKRDQNN